MERSQFRSLLGKLPFVIPIYHSWLRRRGYQKYLQDFERFERLDQSANPRLSLRREDQYPIFGDNTQKTAFDATYIYHVSWAARVLARTKPPLHIDIASSLYFATVVSAFIPIDFYDYRPAYLSLSGLKSKEANLMNLPFADHSVDSLSCMHVIEHIGLGRYGDPLDPDGDIKAMTELKRVLAPGGVLLFVTPIGQPRICFNAHRIYSYRMIIEQFSELKLEAFMLITDDAQERGPIENASESECDRQTYGCGCFMFRRLAANHSY